MLTCHLLIPAEFNKPTLIKPIFEHLEEQISYNDIRVALGILKAI